MTIRELNIPKAIIEHGEEQVKLGLYIDFQDYAISILRRNLEANRNLGETNKRPQSGSKVSLATITHIAPGSDRRLGKIAKAGDILQLTGQLGSSDYLGVSVKLLNYDSKYKSTAWFFARGLEEGERTEDFPQRDQRSGWLNSWWYPLLPTEISGDESVYVFNLHAMISEIRTKFNEYRDIEFEGISTLRYSQNLRLTSIHIYRSTND